MANKKAKNAAAKVAKASASQTAAAASGLANGVDGTTSGATTPLSSVIYSSDGASTPSLVQKADLESPEELAQRAEGVKEAGNTAFKAGRYGEAIDQYTEAIQLSPSEPSYLTNRAAAYMALKRFRPALEDCQHAASLQTASPSPKTLVRLARCQLALGSAIPATSTVNGILSIEPTNAPALQLREKIKVLEGHVKNFETARGKKEWGLARLALDKCLQAIEGEGGEIPVEWRIWRVELDLARGNWDGANTAANDALRTNSNSPDILTLRGLVLFLSGKLPQALQHVQNALRLDPSCEPAQKLRRRVKDVERLKEEGNTAFKGNKLEEALSKYMEALERIGEAEEDGRGGQIRATLLSNRATTLLKLSRHEEALKDIDISLDLSPNSFKALRTRARIRLHLEKFDGAIADFKAAIQQAQTEGGTKDADVRALRTELKKAEAALKRSKTKDYYKILGVARDCNDADIKKAYRKESLKHHPDKGGDEEKFKLVVEAHAVLSDSQRRARYDMGEDEDGMNEGGPGGMGGFSHVDLSDIFAQFHGGGMGGGMGGGGFPGGASGTGGRRGFYTQGFSF